MCYKIWKYRNISQKKKTFPPLLSIGITFVCISWLKSEEVYFEFISATQKLHFFFLWFGMLELQLSAAENKLSRKVSSVLGWVVSYSILFNSILINSILFYLVYAQIRYLPTTLTSVPPLYFYTVTSDRTWQVVSIHIAYY